MKRIGIGFSIVALSFLILLGSGGITIGKMICGDGDCTTTSYSLGKAKDCCASANTSEGSLSCCCTLINVSYLLDDFSVSEKVNITAQELSLLILPTANWQLPAFSFFALIPTFVDSSPPPLRELLLSICTLRI